MAKNKMIFIGEKESFIVRVLIKKIYDTGADCSFVPWKINDINSHIDNVSLITLYMDEGERPNNEVLHYIGDKMNENDIHMIIIGEEQDIRFIFDHIRGDLIYATFTRPVDNTVFTERVRDYFAKAEEGSFKKSILVVDDDPNYLSLVREWLKDMYKVSMANSGLQAIKWLGKNKVDLILLDHEMPVTSGPQVLEMLRSDPETKGIPVMFLTGKRDKESVMRVVALHPEGYFIKSIKKDELLKNLQEFFILHK